MRRVGFASQGLLKLEATAWAAAVPEHVIEEIRRLCPPDEDGDSLFYHSCLRGQRKGRTWIWVRTEGKGSGVLKIGINWDSELVDSPESLHASAESFFALFNSCSARFDFECFADLEMPFDSRTKTIVPLPLKLVDSPSLPFDDIDAMNFVKHEESKEKYSVLLGIAGEGPRRSIKVMTRFGASSDMASDVLGEIAATALRIVTQFTWRTGKRRYAEANRGS